MNISHTGLHPYLARLVAIIHLLATSSLVLRSIMMSSNVRRPS
jgi:hypothetical protein